ncbi:D-alanine--poly(phosphoribitol) ligase, partial [Klebsiella pneumoniae]|nr:D-alanine--poly(phosphoribitol) ligase [Klebsiella pneumoniae]
LVTGGACVLCARETIADRQAFAAYLARTHVNVWASTPSFVRQQLLDADFDQQHLPDLRVFVFGAESLTPTVAEALWSR